MSKTVDLEPIMHHMIRPMMKLRSDSKGNIEEHYRKNYISIPDMYFTMMIK